MSRPGGITGLALFFAAGALISAAACVELWCPGSALEPMWRLNPRAREAFGHMGPASIVLMASVSVACALAAAGLWRGRRWGHRAAVVLLVLNLLGDVVNAALGIEPRALVGVPVVAAILVYLASPRVRVYFRGAGSGG